MITTETEVRRYLSGPLVEIRLATSGAPVLGYVLQQGPLCWSAETADDRLVGHYEHRAAAVAAVVRAAGGAS